MESRSTPASPILGHDAFLSPNEDFYFSSAHGAKTKLHWVYENEGGVTQRFMSHSTPNSPTPLALGSSGFAPSPQWNLGGSSPVVFEEFEMAVEKKPLKLSSRAQSTSSSASAKPRAPRRRTQVRRACQHCAKAHAACDNNRPCGRCAKLGLTDCAIPPRKQSRRSPSCSRGKTRSSDVTKRERSSTNPLPKAGKSWVRASIPTASATAVAATGGSSTSSSMSARPDSPSTPFAALTISPEGNVRYRPQGWSPFAPERAAIKRQGSAPAKIVYSARNRSLSSPPSSSRNVHHASNARQEKAVAAQSSNLSPHREPRPQSPARTVPYPQSPVFGSREQSPAPVVEHAAAPQGPGPLRHPNATSASRIRAYQSSPKPFRSQSCMASLGAASHMSPVSLPLNASSSSIDNEQFNLVSMDSLFDGTFHKSFLTFGNPENLMNADHEVSGVVHQLLPDKADIVTPASQGQEEEESTIVPPLMDTQFITHPVHATPVFLNQTAPPPQTVSGSVSALAPTELDLNTAECVSSVVDGSTMFADPFLSMNGELDPLGCHTTSFDDWVPQTQSHDVSRRVAQEQGQSDTLAPTEIDSTMHSDEDPRCPAPGSDFQSIEPEISQTYFAM